MQLSGAFISTSTQNSQPSDIILPFQNKEITHIALDLGGTLAKVVYFTKRDSSGGRLVFAKFETQKIDELIQFLKSLVNNMETIKISATGGGSHKFAALFKDELGVILDKQDEMDCTVKGMNFLLKEIPYEVFSYDYKDIAQPIKYVGFSKPKYPFLLVNIGSGVSIIKVNSEDDYERISGSSLGGATFWSLTSLFASHSKLDKLDFDDILDMTKKGNNHNIDLLVGDIYGSDYSKIGLKSTTIASSCGKIFKKLQDGEINDLNPEDISLSLLYMISNNIGQIAYLHAKLHNIEHIYFGGFFIRGHLITMATLSYAVNFWSKGEMTPLFSRHEGFLGALGAFLSMNTKNRDSFHENFMHSSKFSSESLSVYGVLDSSVEKLVSFPLLKDPSLYYPDTFNLDNDSRDYYLTIMEKSIPNTIKIANQHSKMVYNDQLPKMTEKYENLFRDKLNLLRKEPLAYGQQSFRTLLNLKEQCLREVGFSDIYYHIKQMDNELALKKYFETVLTLDHLPVEKQIEQVLYHVLAGNMFDWGSSEVLELVEKGALMFNSILEKIKVASIYDHMDKASRCLIHKAYKKCIIFVDNSGCDIILGILPLTRFLLKKDSKPHIILAANSFPALNDITVLCVNIGT